MSQSPEITGYRNHDNFISEYQSNLDGSKFVDFYERMAAAGAGLITPRSTGAVKNEQLFITQLLQHEEQSVYNTTLPIAKDWNHIVMSVLHHYMETYEILKNTPFEYKYCKLQKTRPSEGYHTWHHDACAPDTYRKLVVIVYLNDGFDGGETEFLYQRCRIEPKMGKIIVFPAGWTHTHRGNPPLNGDKYIMNGWIEEFPQNSYQHGVN